MSEDGVVGFERVSSVDVVELREFLTEVDLTVAGLDEPAVKLWIERGPHGEIIGSTGLELSEDGEHALIRSVAVAAGHRSAGTGSRLARHAIEQARAAGASRAWLFSRRSGAFWQKLGFVPADCDELAAVLAGAHQVRHFAATGELASEVAWTRGLTGAQTGRRDRWDLVRSARL